MNDKNAVKAFKKVFGDMLHPNIRNDDERLEALLRSYLKEIDKYYLKKSDEPLDTNIY